jgi:hypothetical protein
VRERKREERERGQGEDRAEPETKKENGIFVYNLRSVLIYTFMTLMRRRENYAKGGR